MFSCSNSFLKVPVINEIKQSGLYNEQFANSDSFFIKIDCIFVYS
jgi:hypothetical protein